MKLPAAAASPALVLALLLATPALAQTATPAPAPMPAPMPAPTPANTHTTQDLVDLCATPQTDPSYPGHIGLCVGYFSGVLDYHLADTARTKRARKVCLPATMPTRGEERSAFLTWAQANQQYMPDPAVYGVMRFLISQYPCRR